MIALWILLSLGIGFVIGYFVFALRFDKKNMRILGTLMIPTRELGLLEKIGDELTIFVGEPGKGCGCHIYAVQGLHIFESSYGGFASGTKEKIIWGASFKLTNKREDFNCIMIPGKITEGIVSASYERSQKSFPRPCLINIVLI